jgi:hypothetical protein
LTADSRHEAHEGHEGFEQSTRGNAEDAQQRSFVNKYSELCDLCAGALVSFRPFGKAQSKLREKSFLDRSRDAAQRNPGFLPAIIAQAAKSSNDNKTKGRSLSENSLRH